MAQNIGTLISAAIRPNDSLDLIASAYASEIKGGLHTTSTYSDRDSIIVERREWGMLCYVESDRKTYQLKYGLVDNDITNNDNWEEFSGDSTNGSSEWIDSVLSISNNEPTSPSDGDRYLVSIDPSIIINWPQTSPIISPLDVVQWNASLNRWDVITPINNMSVRVADDNNTIYRFDSTNNKWIRERLNQVIQVDATSLDGTDYTSTSTSFTGFENDAIYLINFDIPNSTNDVYLSINGTSVQIKKPASYGLIDFDIGDISTTSIYTATYDGSYLQMSLPYSNDSVTTFGNKYYITSTDNIVVPLHHQYWIYGDLTIDGGTLTNYGHVVIADGGLIFKNGGTYSESGTSSALIFTTMNVGGISASNGLNIGTYSNSVELGGVLNKDTFIDGDGYDFIIGDADSILFTASNFDVEADGFFSIDAGKGSGQIMADDSIIISGSNSVGVISNGPIDMVGSSFNVNGVEIDPIGPTAGYVLTSDGTKFVPMLHTSSTPGGTTTEYEIGLTSLETNGNYEYTGITISKKPVNRVEVFVNGQSQNIGDGVTSDPNIPINCYFGTASSSPRLIKNIKAGDNLYWNGGYTNYELDANDRISIIYEI